MKALEISTPAFQYTDAKGLQFARGRAKTTVSTLGDEFVRPEQVLRLVPTFPLMTANDTNMEIDSYRVTPRFIVNHRTLRGFSGTVSVLYLTFFSFRIRYLHAEELVSICICYSTED